MISMIFGVAPALVINEYGMTEMCSQLYDATLFNSGRDAANRINSGYRMKLAPPWLRTTVIDPVTLKPLDEGQIGLLARKSGQEIATPVETAIETPEEKSWLVFADASGFVAICAIGPR